LKILEMSEPFLNVGLPNQVRTYCAQTWYSRDFEKYPSHGLVEKPANDILGE
jgi:hypothetical protein